MFPIALAFCAGAAALHALPALWPASVPGLLLLGAGLVVRRFPAAAAFLIGFAWSHLLASAWLAAGWPCERDREELVLTGRVSAPALERSGRTDFDLDVLDWTAAGRRPSKVRLSWYETSVLPQPGDEALTWRECEGDNPLARLHLGKRFNNDMDDTARTIHKGLGVNWAQKLLADAAIMSVSKRNGRPFAEWRANVRSALLDAGADVDCVKYAEEHKMLKMPS